MFCARLKKTLDAVHIASIRLALEPSADDDLKRAAEELLCAADGTDVSVIIEDRPDLARALGLDGIHLSDGPKNITKARRLLNADQVIGVFCGATRHTGLRAGEAGADYVAFGPVRQTRRSGAETALPELFEWWREFTVLPSMAEGGIDGTVSHRYLESADFLMLGAELWELDDPFAAIGSIAATAACSAFKPA